MTNLELSVRLHQLAELYANNPEACQPYDFSYDRMLTVFCHGPQETSATLRVFGPGTKRDDDDAMGLTEDLK